MIITVESWWCSKQMAAWLESFRLFCCRCWVQPSRKEALRRPTPRLQSPYQVFCSEMKVDIKLFFTLKETMKTKCKEFEYFSAFSNSCRPVNNFSETLTVKLGLRLSQLIDVVICNNTKTKRKRQKYKKTKTKISSLDNEKIQAWSQTLTTHRCGNLQ